MTRCDRPWYAERRQVAAPEMRVSTEERNEVADALSTHFADGRLDDAEFKERLDRALGAKTRGDLAGLLTDLPRPDAEAPSPRRRRRLPLVAMAVVALVVAATWSVRAAPHLGWLLLVVVVFVVLRNGRLHPRGHRHASDGV
jgi:hypothetical protein